jgi:hypothetical protein
MAKEAFLQFKGGEAGPFMTVGVPIKETERPSSGQTVSGYGRKLPTPYMVKWEGRWRRVYVAQFSNAGTAYLGKPGNWLCTVDIY